MGIYLSLQNHDDLFNKSPVPPIIINDISTITEAENESVKRLISTRYDTDLMSNEPSCDCGELVGGYNLGTYCNNCKTQVKELFDQELNSIVWMRSPKGVEKLLNPMIVLQLSKRFTRKGFNIIEWLCNTDYHPNIPKPPEIDELLMQGVVRGYNNFIQNFDNYLDILCKLKTSKKEENEDLLLHISQSRDCIMSWHIPLPNKSLLVIEDTDVGVFVDPIVVGAVDAIRTICSIDTPLANYTLRQRENRAAKTLFILSMFSYRVYDEILASKNGLFRKHIFGSRNFFSTRAVISSNTRTHAYDELHISWAAGITMLKPYVMNKLNRLGYTPEASASLLQRCIYMYHPVIDNIFKELIDESRDKCFYALYGRNPSLSRSSSQRMRITKIKTDINDVTITMSILVVKGFNADFDGDQMNLVLIQDNETADQAQSLAPHKNMFDINSPRTISKSASLPKPVVSTISNWIHYTADMPQYKLNDEFSSHRQWLEKLSQYS